MLSSFLSAAEAIAGIKKQEVPLPIAQKQAIVTPLRVGDDLTLRSSLTSPVNYDREMTRMLYDHSEVVLSEGAVPVKENFERFCATLSNIDKICLIWALYKTTYETLGMRQFKCDKDNCKTEFKQEVTLDSLIQEDTFTIWEEDKNFYEFVYPIEVEYEGFIYGFESRLPSIRDNNKLMSNLSIDALQNNLNQTGALFTRREQMTLLSKAVSIRKKGMPIDSDIPRTENMQEMLMAFTNYVPHIVSEDFFIKYREKFDKYYPKFYTNILCPSCNNTIRFQIDLEVEFFRRSLFGRGESVEEL
ncbi:MAG TPA: hypothetical protein PLL26_04705 [Candidatus Dojkabacteria bacterium]|nr:hypothetical protein [Candidatus Dojkabacteria bacterium]